MGPAASLGTHAPQVPQGEANLADRPRLDRALDRQQADPDLLDARAPPHHHRPQHQDSQCHADGLRNVWRKTAIPASTTHVQYNLGMGGCDISDQSIAYYLRHMQAKAPYKVIFFFSIKSAVNNTRILHGKAFRDGAAMRTKDVLTKLKDVMLKNGQRLYQEREALFRADPPAPAAAAAPAPAPVESGTYKHWTRQPAELRLDGSHNPVVWSKTSDTRVRRRCILCTLNKKGWSSKSDEQTEQARRARLRRNAPPGCMCLGALATSNQNQIPSQCLECNVFLCLASHPDDVDSSCWALWHGVSDLTSLRA